MPRSRVSRRDWETLGEKKVLFRLGPYAVTEQRNGVYPIYKNGKYEDGQAETLEAAKRWVRGMARHERAERHRNSYWRRVRVALRPEAEQMEREREAERHAENERRGKKAWFAAKQKRKLHGKPRRDTDGKIFIFRERNRSGKSGRHPVFYRVQYKMFRGGGMYKGKFHSHGAAWSAASKLSQSLGYPIVDMTQRDPGRTRRDPTTRYGRTIAVYDHKAWEVGVYKSSFSYKVVIFHKGEVRSIQTYPTERKAISIALNLIKQFRQV